MSRKQKRPLELRYVRRGDLKPNPKNWRVHGPEQRAALEEALARVGYAGALLANERSGELVLIDGHLRTEIGDPDEQVPVLVGSWSDADADYILGTLDPIGAAATADSTRLESLLAELNLSEESAMHKLIGEQHLVYERNGEREQQEVHAPESFKLLVECNDEATQQHLYEQLSSEGYECRVLTM